MNNKIFINFLNKKKDYLSYKKTLNEFSNSKLVNTLFNKKHMHPNRKKNYSIFSIELDELNQKFIKFDKIGIKYWADICFAPGEQVKYIKKHIKEAQGIGVSLQIKDGGYKVVKGVIDERFKGYFYNLLTDFKKIINIFNKYPNEFNYVFIGCFARHNKIIKNNTKDSYLELLKIDIQLQLRALYIALLKLKKIRKSCIMILYSIKNLTSLANLFYILKLYFKTVVFYKSEKYFNYRGVVYIKATNYQYENLNLSYLHSLIYKNLHKDIIFDINFMNEFYKKIKKILKIQQTAMNDILNGKITKLLY